MNWSARTTVVLAIGTVVYGFFMLASNIRLQNQADIARARLQKEHTRGVQMVARVAEELTPQHHPCHVVRTMATGTQIVGGDVSGEQSQTERPPEQSFNWSTPETDDRTGSGSCRVRFLCSNHGRDFYEVYVKFGGRLPAEPVAETDADVYRVVSYVGSPVEVYREGEFLLELRPE